MEGPKPSHLIPPPTLVTPSLLPPASPECCAHADAPPSDSCSSPTLSEPSAPESPRGGIPSSQSLDAEALALASSRADSRARLPKRQKVRGSYPETFGLDLSPAQVAHTLTAHTLRLFRQVDYAEFLGYGFGLKQLAPTTILPVIAYFNRVSNWVASRILQNAVLEVRVSVFRNFISLAHELHKIHNFHLLFAVCAGLESSPVSRLKQTIAGLSDKHRARIKALRDWGSPDKNYSNYRDAVLKLRLSKQTCVPYLGVYLRDLTFIHEGNATLTNDLINLSKMLLVSQPIQEFIYFRTKSVRLPPDQYGNALFSELPGNSSNPEELYQTSLLLEPREVAAKAPDASPVQPHDQDYSPEVLSTLDPAILPRFHLERAFLALQKENMELKLRIKQLEEGTSASSS